ncbi:CHASE2 domain-containing protein [Thiospirochaeta perfilievii]|uniref:CHASE2 domain-containing protein n=1 Tax=Thiospirochaeta perfilievii TaxID=252967 RepID=A0A5C1QCR6_9SPIO|nr:adenylate/guanylate cyclase domain-containing protein [Thiospirochaeta perfilievii]QEN04476.1 CHASE2 domain-containing protein [Thiospirochaeta perfilievii]
MKKKNLISFLIPFFIVSLISLLGVYTSTVKDIDNKLYDTALNIKPLSKISGKFLDIQVDDKALELLKMYPLKRSTLADGMLILKEFGAESVLLDTQLVDPSTPGLNSTKFNELPDLFDQVKNNSLSISTQLIKAFASGSLGGEDDSLEVADEYIEELEWEYDDLFDDLKESTKQVALDYDEYISNIFKLMDNVYVTNDFELGKSIPKEFETYIEETQALKNIVIHSDPFEKRFGTNPAIQMVMESAKGSGFVETLLDGDGKTRRSHIILKKGDKYYPHLSFISYLDRVGNPEINVYKNKMVLKGVKDGDKEPFDLTIPLAFDGSMVIDWAGKEYKNTFNHINFYELYHHDTLMLALNNFITKILTDPTLSKLAGRDYNNVYTLFELSEDIKTSGDKSSIDDYRDYREQIVEISSDLIKGTAEKPSLNKEYRRQLTLFLDQYDVTDDEKGSLLKNADDIDNIYNTAKENLDNLIDFREKFKNKMKDSVVTFGYTATSTFDIGSNPFEKEYSNMGIYPTIFNNLLSRKFITLTPIWLSIIMAFIFALLATVIIKRNEAKTAIILGLLLFLIIISLYLGLFIATGIYIQVLIPALSFILVFIQKISGKLLSTSKDKAFIKNAFGQYLSEDVIKDIINDPSKLKLGGEEKEITAFFTDVKGFSTISEKLTPDELVSLLNEYLTAMSDIALEHKGTIDKYEGDAIIGFFGAPAPLPDHATKAVLAAIRMKQVEKKLNVSFKERGMTPSPVNTRIGINSGPCVVGNMGTPKKMDYTMMGSDVNIAARLEGVNKQYGTWILASERTMDKAEDIFLSRRLDRVRVVGINKPIRLYNPIAVKTEATESEITLVEKFEIALTSFEERNWKEAKNLFKDVLKIAPEDKPSIRYIQLCDKFIIKEPEQDWDGVFNLTSK